MDLVTVIIPLYNQAQYVAEAIESVLSQTYKEIEIILINDGSTDNAQEILAPYIDEKKIHYIYQENKGLSAARNRGLKEARGKFIKFLDSDDFLYPEQIEKQVNDIKNEPSTLSITDFHDLRPDGKMVRRHIYIKKDEWQLASFIRLNHAVHAFLTPKALIEEAGGFDETFTACEDWDLWLRLLQQGAFIKHLPEAGCCYRISNTSMSADTGKMFTQECKIIEKVNGWLKREKELSVFIKDCLLEANLRLIEEGFARKIDLEDSLPHALEMTDLIVRERKKGVIKFLYKTLGVKNYTAIRYAAKRLEDPGYEYRILHETKLHRHGQEQEPLRRGLSRMTHLKKAFSLGNNKGIILMYHRVTKLKSDPWELSVTPEHFEQQMQVLMRLGKPVRIGEMTRETKSFTVGNKEIAVTFDDGYADSFHNAKPILEKYGIPATFFIVSNAVGSSEEFWWDELEKIIFSPYILPPLFLMSIAEKDHYWQIAPKETGIYYQDIPPNGITISKTQLYFSLWKILSQLSMGDKQQCLKSIKTWSRYESSSPRANNLPMGLEELSCLARSPYFEIGAHTKQHPLLSKLPKEVQLEEIRSCKQSLEKMLKVPVKIFAYPHGDYSETTVGLIKELGFAAACTTEQAPMTKRSDIFRLPRFNVLDWDGPEFENRILLWLKQGI